jgi:hypothetical protein
VPRGGLSRLVILLRNSIAASVFVTQRIGPRDIWRFALEIDLAAFGTFGAYIGVADCAIDCRYCHRCSPSATVAGTTVIEPLARLGPSTGSIDMRDLNRQIRSRQQVMLCSLASH